MRLLSGSKILSLLSPIDGLNDKFVETIDEYLTMRYLKNDKSFIINLADKGSAVLA